MSAIRSCIDLLVFHAIRAYILLVFFWGGGDREKLLAVPVGGIVNHRSVPSGVKGLTTVSTAAGGVVSSASSSLWA